MKNPSEILKRYWGYDSFRPLQQEIINSVLQGCDTLALLPTGGGKSVCYQVPALMQEGMCLVVSPLIALMKDQVQQLTKKGIKSVCLSSTSSSQEQFAILSNCIHGKVKVLYVTPERLRQRMFIEHFKQMQVSLIAVDEAHCISQWGYDFRPAYLQIATIRQYVPDVPVLALTATATPTVAEDICRQLEFRRGGRRFQSSFVRPNLAYMVFHETDKLGRLLRIARTTGGGGIVYVRNRRRTREVAQFLTTNGIPATFYHAGLTFQERNISQAQWTKNEIPVMVATNAFGMGIDKGNVSFVVHLDIPDSLEAYFQEAGRAGRDGNKAYAVLLYDDEDMTHLEKSYETNYPTLQQIGNTYRALCNYYQLPLGAGDGCEFDFDIEAICNTYHFNVVEFYTAIRFLQREGLLDIPDLDDTRSTLQVTLNREDLYRFQVDQGRLGDLMATLLRMYGGLSTTPQYISERDIARRVFIEPIQVMAMLQQMQVLHAVEYHPRRTKPYIVFTSPRMEARDLYFSKIDYPLLQQRARERMEAMRSYVTADSGCRSRLLVGYFGEEKDTVCGCCDLCIANTKKQHAPALRQRILDMLAESPKTTGDLLQALQLIDEKELSVELRRLVDEGRVSVNQRLQFFV